MINMVWSDKNIQKIQTGIDENAYNRMTAERRGRSIKYYFIAFLGLVAGIIVSGIFRYLGIPLTADHLLYTLLGELTPLKSFFVLAVTAAVFYFFIRTVARRAQREK